MRLWEQFDRIVVFDTETTGVDFRRDRIIEIGAVSLENGAEARGMDLFIRLPEGRRFLPLRLVGTLLTAGAIGNMIDRTLNSFVVDFLYFKLIDFPVFNVADCYVTVGAALLAVLILFYYKEEELGFIKAPKEEKDGSEEKV